MTRRLEYSRVCLFIDESLRPYKDKIGVSITKENEKQLLATLSQVFRQINIWTHEVDCESDLNMLEKLPGNCECPVGSNSHSQPPHCLSKIICNLVFLLAIDSEYVQHIAGNLFFAVSKFVVASESYWKEFMHALCFCLDTAICNSLSSSLGHPITAKYLVCDSSSFVLDLNPSLSNANWSSVGGIFRLLCNILKHLKHANNDQLVEIYLDSLSSCLPNLPWDMWNKIFVCHVGQQKSWYELCGYLVRLFCSLVDHGSSVKDSADCVSEHPTIREVSNIVPKVLVWCFGMQGDCNDKGLSHYFRHKILVLMIKLSSHLKLDCSILVSWLHLIHKYFEDLLLEPLTQLESGVDDCLEGSPFLPCLYNEERKSMSHRHLQRLTVFLFLKCSFSLVSLRGRSNYQCCCANLTSCMASDQSWSSKCCRKKGLVELYEWLQKHVPANVLENYEPYSERRMSFTKSFLQLYVHEDDLLFEVLLQLSYIPLKPDQIVCEERNSQEVEDEMLFRISEFFHPVCLFHLFLAELLYDHEVLLDYLISKDTGAGSAEYLLRCLRTVCDSWKFFMEFSFGEVTKQSSSKKRKRVDGFSDQPELLSTDVECGQIPFSLEEEYQIEHLYGSDPCRTITQPCEAAVVCLLSLKTSVENLCKKELFPYNPEVLLRRLKMFQELCPVAYYTL